jgi:hypothetical protein
MDWLKTAAAGIVGGAIEGGIVYLALSYIYGPPTL